MSISGTGYQICEGGFAKAFDGEAFWFVHIVFHLLPQIKFVIDFLSSQKETKDAVLGHWAVMPPLGHISKASADGKTPKVDPGPGIMEQIATIAASPILSSTIQKRPSVLLASEDSDDSEEGAVQSSGWESEESEGIEVTDVVMDANTGDATFATL
jgi:hypothetical protein